MDEFLDKMGDNAILTAGATTAPSLAWLRMLPAELAVFIAVTLLILLRVCVKRGAKAACARWHSHDGKVPHGDA
jgi:hypothetical protein